MSSVAPEINVEQGVTVVSVGESVDERSLEEVRGMLLGVSTDANPPWVVVDMSRTEFFGSSFIELLFRVWNRLGTREGGQFAISGLTPYCAEVLKVTHLDRLWKIYTQQQDAVRAMGSR